MASGKRTSLMSPARLERGWVIVLPGIEGRSPLNNWVVTGLVQGEVPYGIEIHDWTRGPLQLWRNLRDSPYHAKQVQILGDKIARYRESHPQQPVYLIGHSGGGAMALFTLEQLSPEVKVSAGLLLLAAVSPAYDYRPALRGTTRGLWNFSSLGDLYALGLGTLLLGTCDGRHAISAGCQGFHQRPSDKSAAHGPELTEIRFQPRMVWDGNLGGHFGAVNPRFVRKWIAPLLCETGRAQGLTGGG